MEPNGSFQSSQGPATVSFHSQMNSLEMCWFLSSYSFF